MGSVNDQLIENLLNEEESGTLDFKRGQYPFEKATDEQKSELLKDILAFTNAWRRITAYVLIGVEEIRGRRSRVVGVGKHLDDAQLQQFVNSKTQRPVKFRYIPFTFESKQIGVIEIPLQDRPVYLSKKYGKLKKDVVYIRYGSSTGEADLDEIMRMQAASESELTKAFQNEAKHVQQIVEDRPEFWEYLLTVELLRTRLIDINRRFDELDRGLIYKQTRSVKGKKFGELISAKCNDIIALMKFFEVAIIDKMVASWGELGEAGDPLEIKRAVGTIVNGCERLLEWEIDLHSINPPDPFLSMKEKMKGWAKHVFKQIEIIPDQIMEPLEDPVPGTTYELQFVIKAHPNIEELTKETKRIMNNPEALAEFY